jgi:hypothetical protein
MCFLVWVRPALGEQAKPEEKPDEAASPPVSVWYRSSAECPDAGSFLEQVVRRGTDARIAAVGDPVDFVVTIGANDGTSAGRLERQTGRGTIAIRELTAPDCKEVAEALALSLSLAAQELVRQDASEPVPAHPGAPDTAGGGPEPGASTPTARPLIETERRPRDSDARSNSAASEQRARSGFALGGQAALAAGLAPSIAPGFELFAGYEAPGAGLVHPSFRLSAVAFRVATDATPGDIRISSLVGRAQGCLLALDAFSLRMESCAAFELGPTVLEATAPTAKRRTRLWAAGLGIVRVRSLGRFWVEAQAAGVVPFIRYRMTYEPPEGAGAAYTTSPLGLQAGLGVGGRLP